MSKAVMRSIKPYYLYLIIIGRKKIEVGKDYPKSPDWNKVVEMYCSKDKKSFNRIPKEDRYWMKRFLGKVAVRFVCDRLDKYCGRLTTYAETPYKNKYISPEELAKTCLSIFELNDYLNGKNASFWHISNLKIYDNPKELGEYNTPTCEKNESACDNCKYKVNVGSYYYPEYDCPIENGKPLTRPPQSWQYVEPLEV